MFYRFVFFLISTLLTTSIYATSTVIVTESVPGATCSCIARDGCVNIQTRKYECNIGSANRNNSIKTDIMLPEVNIPARSQNQNIIGNTIDNYNTNIKNHEFADTINKIILCGIFIYFIPTIIVLLNRNRAHRVATILINIFLGWSVIGWFVALFLSLQSSVVKIQLIQETK